MPTPEGWTELPLGEAGEWLSGGTPSKDNAVLWQGEIPWVSPKDMKRARIGDAQDHVAHAAIANGTRLVPPNTLLMVIRGMILAHTFPVALTTRDVTFNQDIKALRPCSAFAPEFLLQWLQSAEAEFLRLVDVANHGTKRLPTELLFAVSVPVPPLPEQRKIAAILSSVDQTIETTEAVIAQLQVVKKAMMQELLTRGMPGRHTRFKQTEIGEIPEGWKVVPLGMCVSERIRNGYSPQCPAEPTGKWTLGLGAVGFDGFDPQARKNAPLDDPRVDASALRAGDLLLSRSNTRARVGLVGIYEGDPSPCSFPDLLMRIRPRSNVEVRFLQEVLLSQRARAYFEGVARGTSGSMVKVDRALVENFPLALPPPSEQVEIWRSIASVEDQRRKEVAVSAALRQTKNALSTVLLSGDLRVVSGVDGGQ